MIKCIVFDRDGTLGELSDKRFPDTFSPFADIRKTFEKIKKKGYLVGIATNQASIARGTGKDYDFGGEFAAYGTDGWEICPHDNADNCDCRKPKNGLLIKLAARLGVSPRECLVVGDRTSDILCALSAGASAALVLTGYGEKERAEAVRLCPTLPVLSRFDEILSLI